MTQRAWFVLYWILFAGFLGTAALNMLHVHAGFFTNHAADLIAPAWLYVVVRGLYSARGRRTLIQRIIGRTPAIAAGSLFVASAATEVSQYFWPRGVFSGRFDSFDLLAYAVGLWVCYVLDTRSPAEAGRGGAALERPAA